MKKLTGKSPADIFWTSYVSGLVTSSTLFGKELCLLRLLAKEREDIFDYEVHVADHVEPWKQCSSALTNGRCLLSWGGLVGNKI